MEHERGREGIQPLGRVKEKWFTYLKGKAGKEAIPGLTLFLVGVLFARTPVVFGAYPLGLALLSSNKRHTLSIFFGLCVGALTLGMQGIVWGVVYMVALLMRLLISMPNMKGEIKTKEAFGESPQLRLITAVVVATASCAYELAVSGVNGSSLLFCLAMLVGSGSLCAAFSGVFSYGINLSDVLGHQKTTPKPTSRFQKVWMEVGVCAILFFVAFSLAEFSIFGLNPALFFTSFATLFLSRRFGALKGCAGGLVVSLAVSATYAPAFGLLGLASGLIWPLGSFYAVGLGAAVGIAWCSYVGGLTGFLGVAPEMVVASLVALPLLPKLYSSAIAGEVKQDRTAAEDAVRDALGRAEGQERHLTRLSGAFEMLSRALSEPSLAPSREDCFALCDRICTGYCANCGGRGVCWDSEERPGATALETMSACIAEGRTLSRQHMPTHLITGCEQLEPLLAEVRREGAKLWQRRRRSVGAEYPGEDYAMVAELLREAAAQKQKLFEVDKTASSLVRRLLSDKGLRAVAVRVMGAREKKVVMASASFSGRQRELTALTPQIEEICGCHLTPPCFETTGEVVVATMRTAPKFKIEVAYAARAAKDGGVSGDCVGTFEAKEEGYSYVVLSDGMGTGVGAAHTAGLCTLFLEKMLSAGMAQDTALRMLNRLVAKQGEERSATVDLMTFDTFGGHAYFMKSGAAASYVKRENNLFRLRSRTIPIGIVRELDAEKLQFDTQAGDLVVMLSDGISQTSEDAPWLVELLSRPTGGQTLEALANAILGEAMTHLPQENGVTVRDDATVIIIKVTTI